MTGTRGEYQHGKYAVPLKRKRMIMGVLLEFGTTTFGAKSDQPTGDQRGFFVGLSEEQKAAVLEYRGEENFGMSCFLTKEDREAFLRDVRHHGVAFSDGSKHIPLEDIFIKPTVDQR